LALPRLASAALPPVVAMCAQTRGPVAAGPHATVEVSNNESSGNAELRLTVNVPFELLSMSDAELDVGPSRVKLQGPAPACEEVCISLPEGFALDPEQAAARYSKKKRQLTITSPLSMEQPSSAAASCEAAPSPAPRVATAPAEAPLPMPAAPQPLRPSGPASAAPTESMASGTAEEDDDDDDMPPPLEASRSAPCKPASSLPDLKEAAAANLSADGLPESEHSNEAAAALMEKALAAREQKRKETEEARRTSDLAASGGLKKGFLSGGKTKKRTTKKAVASRDVEEIPFITGFADPEAARRESLKLPEVQRMFVEQSSKKLKEDNSWVTPQLIQALASRPDLSKAMSDPKIQEAMALMQSDPEAAKKKYKEDSEVTSFLKDFTGLMATHFEVLGKEASSTPQKLPSSPAESPKPIEAPIAGLDLAAKPPPATTRPPSNGHKTGLPIDDPEVMRTLQDPEVQSLIAGIKAGRPFELHELGQSNPKLLMKVKILLDSGLLAMEH